MTGETEINEKKLFQDGGPGGPGRPKENEEQKLMRKATKEIIAKYKERLAQHLPKIEPVLLSKAESGDMVAIKEIHDRVMGKPPQDLTVGSNPELPFRIVEIKRASTPPETT